MTRLDGTPSPVRITLEVILVPDADRHGWSLEAKNLETGDLLALSVNPHRRGDMLVGELARAVSQLSRLTYALWDDQPVPPAVAIDD